MYPDCGDAMIEPLADPILEAFAQIMSVCGDEVCPSDQVLIEARMLAKREPYRANAIIQEAARQIDQLRAAGVIPKGGE